MSRVIVANISHGAMQFQGIARSSCSHHNIVTTHPGLCTIYHAAIMHSVSWHWNVIMQWPQLLLDHDVRVFGDITAIIGNMPLK